MKRGKEFFKSLGAGGTVAVAVFPYVFLYLRGSLGGFDELQPFFLGVNNLGGYYLDLIACSQSIIHGYNPIVDLGSHATISEICVDVICKIQNGCTDG